MYYQHMQAQGWLLIEGPAGHRDKLESPGPTEQARISTYLGLVMSREAYLRPQQRVCSQTSPLRQ